MTPDAAKVLPTIYDTALTPGRWRHALDEVVRLTEARAAALLIRRPDRFSRDRQMLSSTFLDFSRSGAGVYYALRYARLQNPDWDFLGNCPVHDPTPDTAAGMARDELDSRPDYAYMRRTIGVGERLGIRLNRDRIRFDGLSIAGADAKPPQANETLAALLPHLTKAAEMGRKIERLRRQAASATAALNRVQVGLMALLPSADILWMNATAKQILDRTDTLLVTPDKRLACSDAEQSRTLAHHLAAVSATAKGEGDETERLMSLTRRDGGDDLLLDVAPLRGSRTDIGEDGALLTLIDPSALPHLPLARFARLHDLTRAEAGVCELLFAGHPVDEIAERRSRSPVTIKNQIAAILSKTQAKSRADLIRLALRVMPPVV